MIITSIEPQKRRALRASVFIEGEFAFGLSIATLADLGLKKGMPVTEESLNQWRNSALFEEAKQSAFALLARRIHSEKELRDKLRKKKFELATIDKVIARLYELDMLSDEHFAEVLIRIKQKRTPLGKAVLKSKLIQKGIPKETIEKVIEKAHFNANELCMSAAERKLKSLSKVSDLTKKKQKLVQFLIRRGFEWDVVNQTIRQLLS